MDQQNYQKGYHQDSTLHGWLTLYIHLPKMPTSKSLSLLNKPSKKHIFHQYYPKNYLKMTDKPAETSNKLQYPKPWNF